MSQPAPASKASPLTATQWLICTIAAIGFAFDIYELLMLPLIARPALLELTGLTPDMVEYKTWVGRLFYIPAFAGGIFGLLGGYLTDRLGRRFVLTWSILLYAFSAFFAGFSTSIEMLLILRCTTFIGVCVEFVAAVAWLAELFPNPLQRETVLGQTQAFSSVGGLLVAVANGLVADIGMSLPAIAIPGFLTGLIGTIGDAHQHEAWRYTLMSGIIPAIPLILIRPFLPESPAWKAKKEAGSLKRPSIGQLFAPNLRRTTLVTAVGFACTLGAAFGAIQQMPQIVPGLKEVQEKAGAAREKAVAAAKEKGINDETKLKQIGGAAAAGVGQKTATEYTKIQEFGGLAGRFLMAFALASVVRWGWTLRMFQIPGLILTPLLFWAFLQMENRFFFEINLEAIYLGKLPITTMSIGMFFVGLFTVAQLSFWGNYLPHMYPMHLRGTGESFAANIGGRLIGTSAALATSELSKYISGAGPIQFATAAAIVGGGCYVIGLIASFFLPEPQPEVEG
ncbi:MAG: MFS transporter [Planctomycetaceae bacterium]|nr:MFS transporter [Planctomycetaceae bacterium]